MLLAHFLLLRGVLRGLPRVDDARRTFAQQSAAVAGRNSTPVLVLLLVACVIFVAGGVGMALNGDRAIGGFGAAFFAACGGSLLYQLALKRRQPPPKPHAFA